MTISDDVRKRVEGLLAEGSSLSIADTESGLETGQGTDFITITRAQPGEARGGGGGNGHGCHRVLGSKTL